jgi:hypothetical protein
MMGKDLQIHNIMTITGIATLKDRILSIIDGDPMYPMMMAITGSATLTGIIKMADIPDITRGHDLISPSKTAIKVTFTCLI